MHPAIELDGVSKAYGGRAVLSELRLAIPKGQFVALVGASGSGKTTVLKTINRLAIPDAGEVRIQGRSATDEPAPQLRRRIGYVFQEIGLFPHLTVAENVAVTPRLLCWPAGRVAERVATLLTLVGLEAGYADRLPAALSGGQRQRVGVARALAAEPQILLMDEPFGALDPITREALGADVRRLHDELSLTTVMVTHDMTEAMLLADRVVVLHSGHIVADGSPAELSRQPLTPEVSGLIHAPRRQAARLLQRLEGGA